MPVGIAVEKVESYRWPASAAPVRTDERAAWDLRRSVRADVKDLLSMPLAGFEEPQETIVSLKPIREVPARHEVLEATQKSKIKSTSAGASNRTV